MSAVRRPSSEAACGIDTVKIESFMSVLKSPIPLQTTTNRCERCSEDLPRDAFRNGSEKICVWCQWAGPEKRALARFKDKSRTLTSKIAENRALGIKQEAFVAWYCGEKDACHYCGLKVEHLRRLRLRRGGFGYFVSWDIDRKDSAKPYVEGNLALSCFVCNMAKGNHFSEAEALTLGAAVREIFLARLNRINPGVKTLIL
jgi:5-methylcytosine-specific restriction endonuclease McrA